MALGYLVVCSISARVDSTAEDFQGRLVVISHIPLEGSKKYELYAQN